ncbi:MAG: hypothetical protein K940chlam7_01102 [Chlamydiae bacterium]|nr:hypothetical protein [Chlamydiota bacterium]
MKKSNRDTYRGHNKTNITSRKFCDILPQVLSQINRSHGNRSDLILAVWPQVVGPKISNFTQAVSFTDGILVVVVKNSTLLSLLVQNDKSKILNALRSKFPKVEVRDIVFRHG